MYVGTPDLIRLTGAIQKFHDKTDLARVSRLTRDAGLLFHDDGFVCVSIQVGVFEVRSLDFQLLCRNFCQKHPYGFMLYHWGVQVVRIRIAEGQL